MCNTNFQNVIEELDNIIKHCNSIKENLNTHYNCNLNNFLCDEKYLNSISENFYFETLNFRDQSNKDIHLCDKVAIIFKGKIHRAKVDAMRIRNINGNLDCFLDVKLDDVIDDEFNNVILYDVDPKSCIKIANE